MKKTILTLLVILPMCIFAQNKYYWNGNKKEYVNDDFTSSVIYEKEKSKFVISKSGSINKIIEHKDKKNGKYKIIEYQGNQKLKSKQFDKSQVRSQSYGLKNQNGEKIWLTHFVVLRLEAGYLIDDLNNIFVQNNATIVEEKYGVVKVKIKNIEDVLNTANQIYETGKVLWCQPDFLIQTYQHNDWEKQYYLNNTNHSYCGFNHDIDAFEAWSITTGCDNITVAIIDDGVEDHPSLNDALGNSRVLAGFTPSGVTADGRPDVCDRHGQACAGIIAAAHSNDIRGIAPNVNVLPVKVRFGTGIPATEYADAINWAWENGADVLSNSWGGSSDQIIIDAINNAQQFGRGGDITTGTPGLGAIVVFSSGNDGANSVNTYAQHAIAVGAINKYDTPAEDIDGNRYTNIGVNQDLVAYGGDVTECFTDDCSPLGFCECDIRTIDRIGNNGYNNTDFTNGFGGTSAACPQVSGAAALILSVNPNLTRQEVEGILFSTAKDLGTVGHDNTYGNGKLNIFAAVQEAVKSLGENLYFNEGFLSYNKIKDNTRIIFSGKPDCGIAAATYFCDVYKAETSIPYTSDWFWYLGAGLSDANPNNGNDYTIIDEGNTTNITTFFYYIRTDYSGRTINKWVPFNPSYSWTRKYIISPPENIEFNQVVHSGENVTLYATNSIKLLPGFKAETGSTFKADISASPNDIICLPNPARVVTLKSAKIEQDITIQDIKIDKIEYEDNVQQDIIQIFPNPNKGNFTINISNEIQSNANFEIFNLTGQILYRGNIIQRNQNVIFTSEKGIYIVKVKNGSSIFTEKIILE